MNNSLPTPEELQAWQALCDAANRYKITGESEFVQYFKAVQEAMPRLIDQVRELELSLEEKIADVWAWKREASLVTKELQIRRNGDIAAEIQKIVLENQILKEKLENSKCKKFHLEDVKCCAKHYPGEVSEIQYTCEEMDDMGF